MYAVAILANFQQNEKMQHGRNIKTTIYLSIMSKVIKVVNAKRKNLFFARYERNVDSGLEIRVRVIFDEFSSPDLCTITEHPAYRIAGGICTVWLVKVKVR